jgi:hypothetical protein
VAAGIGQRPLTGSEMPARSRVAVVSAGDRGSFDALCVSLASIDAARQRHGFDVVVLDLGLDTEQVAGLQSAFRARRVLPQWPFEPPAALRTAAALAHAVRPAVPRVVPGYDTYLWWDSGAVAVDDRSIERYLDGAHGGRFVIASADDPAYRLDWRNRLGQHAKRVSGFGLSATLAMMEHPPVNDGVWAARARHPIWSVWQTLYEAAVRRTRLADVDRHALHLIAARRDVPVLLLAPEHSWMSHRCEPIRDRETRRMLSPTSGRPISVLHQRSAA